MISAGGSAPERPASVSDASQLRCVRKLIRLCLTPPRGDCAPPSGAAQEGPSCARVRPRCTRSSAAGRRRGGHAEIRSGALQERVRRPRKRMLRMVQHRRCTMSTLVPASLDSSALALRLRELAGEERNVQVDFLLHLDEFDRRRAFVEAGHPSLWSYCLEVLHLREGSAGRRIQAMKVLRRFPTLESALRDGRLCLSTAVLLGQVLTEENLEDLLARAAYRTRAEVDHLVASVQARTAPRAGIRKLPEREPARASVPLPLAPGPTEPAAEAADPHARALTPQQRRSPAASRRTADLAARARGRQAEACVRDARRDRQPVVAPRHHRPRLQGRFSTPSPPCSRTRSPTATWPPCSTRRSAARWRSTASAGAPSLLRRR